MIRSSSPIGGRRACLCKDNTYSIECCKGLILNQGIGSLTNQQNSSVTNTQTILKNVVEPDPYFLRQSGWAI